MTDNLDIPCVSALPSMRMAPISNGDASSMTYPQNLLAAFWVKALLFDRAYRTQLFPGIPIERIDPMIGKQDNLLLRVPRPLCKGADRCQTCGLSA